MVDYRTSHPSPGVNLDRPERALAVGAHPDDAEFGAGGVLAKWAAGGTHVNIMVLSDGSKGTWDPSVKPSDLKMTRAKEQVEAARRLGAAGVINLGLVDGELEYSLELRALVCEQIRLQRPEVVLTHDPWRRYMMHPDHRVTGWAVVDGVVAARDPLFFPEQLKGGLQPHRPAALLLWAADEPDHWEDIAGFAGRKAEALLAHSSQSATTMEGAGDSAAGADRFRREIRRRAREAAPDGWEEAEAFKRLTP